MSGCSRKRAAIAVATWAVLVGGGWAADAARDPAALVVSSETAERRVSYSGTKVIRVYRPEDGSVAMERVVKVWHRSPQQTRVEIVTPAESLGMVMVENGEGLFIFHPRRQSWRRMPWRAPESRPQLLLRNYQPQFLRRDRVAGRPAVVLKLSSRNPGNPSKTVWIDTQTKLALRHEVYDPEGRRVSSSEFREISFEPSLPANLFSVPAEARVERPRREGGGVPPWLLERQGTPASSIEPPRYVPPGYELVHRFSMRRDDREFAHLRYTDGLNTISLFVERSPEVAACAEQERRPAGRERRRGGPWGRPGPPRDVQSGEHGNSLTLTRGDTRYTLVGNISVKELQRMADSIPPPRTEARR